MMLKLLLKLLGKERQELHTQKSDGTVPRRIRSLASARALVDDAIDPGHEVLDPEREIVVWSDVPHYPAYDQGFPVVSADKLLSTYSNLVSRIAGLSNFDGATSRDAIHRILHNYAEYVHALPASYLEHYYGAGGLLKLGLDVGFHSLQASNGVVFTKESAEIRARAEPRWKLATFIAGIACEVYRTISSMRITNQRGDEWSPLIESLTEWLERTQSTRYWVIWVKNDDVANQRSVVSMIIPHLVDTDILEYISKERQALLMMFSSITSGVRPSDSNPIALLVEKKRFQLIKRDVERNPNKLGKPQIGSHIDPSIIDAIRSLLKTQVWQVNQKGGRVWLTAEGCFVAWKQGGPELIKRLGQNDIPGMPNDAETIREIMQAHGIIERNPSGKTYWSIVPEGAKATVDAVKISKPILIIPDFEALASQALFSLLKPLKENSPESDNIVSTKVRSSEDSKDGAKSAQKKPRTPKKSVSENSEKSTRGPEVEEEQHPLQSDLSLNQPSDDHVTEGSDETHGFSQVTIGDVLETDSAAESPVENSEHMDLDEKTDREARELSRLPKQVAEAFRELIKDYKAGKLKLHSFAGEGAGVPFEVLEARVGGAGVLPVLTSLSKIGALYVPAGQSAKIIMIDDGQGQKKKVIGLTRIFAISVFGWKEE